MKVVPATDEELAMADALRASIQTFMTSLRERLSRLAELELESSTTAVSRDLLSIAAQNSQFELLGIGLNYGGLYMM